MRKRLVTPILAVVVILIMAAPVLAAYYTDIDVTESNGTSYDMLPILVTMPIDYLAEHQFISENGTDVRIEDSQGSSLPFMLAEDRVVLAAEITGDTVNTLQMTTGNTPLDSFPVCTGYGGNVTISDHANLELGDDFEIEFEGYMPQICGLIVKDGSFNVSNPSGDLSVIVHASLYYYEESLYEDDWAVGYSSGAGSQLKESDHLYLDANTDYQAERTYVIDSAVNLTSIDTIYVDWENTGTETWQESHLCVSTSKASSRGTYDARDVKNNDFSRTIDSVDVSGLSGDYYIRVHAYVTDGAASWESELKVYNIWGVGGTSEVTATSVSTSEHLVRVYVDGTDLKLDVDGSTEDTENFAKRYVTDNANDWIISIPYFNYYAHTTNETLRLTYEPDSIIEGTTLPNEEDPGTYDGTISWGSNPAGINVTYSALQLEETYYVEDIEGSTQDIIAPEPAEMTTDVDLDKLENNPLSPMVNAIADVSNGQLTARLIWLGGAWFIFIVTMVFVFIKSRENIVFTTVILLGLSILFYVMGIFNYAVIILVAIGFIAAIIHERMPTW